MKIKMTMRTRRQQPRSAAAFLFVLLVVVLSLLGKTTSAFSLMRSSSPSSPMVQHIVLKPPQPQRMTATSSTPTMINGAKPMPSSLNAIQSGFVKVGILAFIAGMCISLPLTLLGPWILYKCGIYNTTEKEKAALRTGQVCARVLSRIIPFVRCSITGSPPTPEPTVWVCNHSSMLDVFILLANDHKLRGPNRRPIKIIYWKQLEDNPITKLLFRQCGFIPVQMANNGHGTTNDYDKSSFRALLKSVKSCFEQGFDVGILPEGQLNPTPEQGLLPVYSGAYTLAKMAKRPIHMMAHYGVYNLWHPQKGISPASRQVKLRVYPKPLYFESSQEFVTTFTKVVGEFGTYGHDLPDAELQAWMDGTAWEKEKMNLAAASSESSSN